MINVMDISSNDNNNSTEYENESQLLDEMNEAVNFCDCDL